MSTPQGQRVLVAEDESLIAMLIEDELSEAGFSIVGPFATCSDAERWLTLDNPDAAVLDHGLADGPCTDLAETLRTRGVPFIVLTGADPDGLPAVLMSAPRLTKPSSLEGLSKAVTQLLPRQST